MSLIPGSYARAAGLQSEINKVTITRVAGSEVQFRRMVDTYQRDLRYHVNHIQREQVKLRRSMRKYRKKLYGSQKEQQGRRQKEEEEKEEARRRKHPKQKRTETVDYIPESANDDGANRASRETAIVPDLKANGKHIDSIGSDRPDSPNNKAGDNTQDDPNSILPQDDLRETGQQPPRKIFLTANKSMAYFKSKRVSKGKHSSKTQTNEEMELIQEYKPSDGEFEDDISLPVITEEREQGNQGNEDLATPSQASKSVDEGRRVRFQGASDDSHVDETTQHKQSSQLPSVISLNTKTIPQSGTAFPAFAESLHPVAVLKGEGSLQRDTTTVGVNAIPSTPVKQLRRKQEVSYGDLIKLQHTHTSSTKQLFNLVDRLASKHGIVDVPRSQASSNRSSSLDPRANKKITQRGDDLKSLMSGSMVKQAAVLYSMKYGYHVPEEAVLQVITPSSLQSVQAANDEVTSPTGEAQTRKNSNMAEVNSSAFGELKTGNVAFKKHSDVSLKVESNYDVRSADEPSDIEFFVQNLPTYAQSLPHKRNGYKNKHRLPISLLEMTKQVSAIKAEQLVDKADPSRPTRDTSVRPTSRLLVRVSSNANLKENLDSDANEYRLQQRKMLPLLPRSRRERVNSLLQERLSENGSTTATIAWQSAFERLKMVHTLVDLRSYFHDDPL